MMAPLNGVVISATPPLANDGSVLPEAATPAMPQEDASR